MCFWRPPKTLLDNCLPANARLQQLSLKILPSRILYLLVMYQRKVKKKTADGKTTEYKCNWRAFVDLEPENVPKFKKLVESTNLTESKILNKLIKRAKIPSSYPNVPTYLELKKFNLEINKIGQNINQISKKVNQEDYVSQQAIQFYFQKINDQLSNLKTISDEVLNIARIIDQAFR
jgi:hypothetical protein